MEENKSGNQQGEKKGKSWKRDREERNRRLHQVDSKPKVHKDNGDSTKAATLAAAEAERLLAEKNEEQMRAEEEKARLQAEEEARLKEEEVLRKEEEKVKFLS
jgi:hypothetical protein